MIETDTVLNKAVALKENGIPFALVTVVRAESPTSAKPGAKAVVTIDGEIDGWIGGGCAQPVVIKVVKKALEDGQAKLIRISPDQSEAIEEGIMDFAMSCHSGGTLDIFVDPIITRPEMLIIGASPAAQSLSGLAHRVGFSVTAAFQDLNRELFPEADRFIDNLAELSKLTKPPSYVVVATQGKRDEEGLEAALSSGSTYIAFIASERKAGKLRQSLKEHGHDASRVDAIISPAGLDIGAVTPEEIALSVLAGIVYARRTGYTNTGSTQSLKPTAGVTTGTGGSCCNGGSSQSEV